jgi:hypothetical protein
MPKRSRKWVTTVYRDTPNEQARFRAVACGPRSSLQAGISSIPISELVLVQGNQTRFHFLAELPTATNRLEFVSLFQCRIPLSVCDAFALSHYALSARI